MRSLHLSLSIIFCLITLGLTSFSQNKDGLRPSLKLTIPDQKNVTIKGNINSLAPSQGLLDEYAFLYIDMVTGKDVIIPISKDTAGNFVVTFPVNGYQEIRLSRGFKIGDETRFDGYFMNRFFVRPGEDMILDYKRTKDYKTENTFKGNMAKANSQQEEYYTSLQEALGSTDLIPFDYLDSIKPGGYTSFKQLLKTKLKEVLDFNTRFFIKSKGDPFLKTQLDIEEKYLVGRYLLMALGKSKEKDSGLLQLLDSIGAPLNNAKAYGNSSYKDFLSSYYMLLQRKTFEKEPEVVVLFTDMAKYLLKEHIEFAEEEKILCHKILDTVNKASPSEIKRFTDNYMGNFGNEYMETFKTKMTFDQIASSDNPFVRDLYLTRLLREKLDNSQLVNINSLISRYNALVRDNPIKAQFLRDYQLAYNRLYKSRLSVKSVLNDAKKLSANAVVKGILDQYKGKVIYLDVWATWCVPCLTEMSNSKKLRDKLAGKNVVFLYLCISSPTESTWHNLIAGHNIEGEHYFLSNSQGAELGHEFNIKMIPRYLIIDKDGTVANAEAGRPSSAKTRLEIEGLLQK